MENKLLDDYLNKKEYPSIKKIITKILICLIIIFSSLIYVKYSDNNLVLYKEYIFNNTFDFMKFKNIYNKYLGNIIKDDNVISVSNTNIFANEKENYLNGYMYYINSDEVINVISSGIVIYVGSKDDINNTVIIQTSDGYDISYGNLDNINVSIYDYVNSGDLLGNANNKLYLEITKDGNYYTYEEYIQNKD